MSRPTIVERAFEIAKEGGFTSWEKLEAQLSREGYENVSAHLRSKTLRDQLLAAKRASRQI